MGHHKGRDRRAFLIGASALGATAFVRARRVAADDPPPETTRIHLVRDEGLCAAPQLIAEELLHAEGFTEIEYTSATVRVGTGENIATGVADLAMNFAAPLLIRVDAGEPVVLISGVHVGCYELFATEQVRKIADLRGKRVAVPGLGSSHHLYLSFLLAYVGLDPRQDVDWISVSRPEGMRLLSEGKVQAYLGFAPDPQELRARHVGHAVVNSSLDRPWSQYFCCMLAGNREFVRNHPVATKRALRAIIKATDLCAAQPSRVARFLVERGYTQRYDYALATMREVPYGRWREYSPEDTVRFYGLRLHEVGMIKSDPNKLIAQGTDWRFLNELKKELKA